MRQGKQAGNREPMRREVKHRKSIAVLLSSTLLVVAAVGGTLAYISTQSDTVENRFEASYVDCSIAESFDGEVKKSVNVTNTGDISAYVRVKLLSYRVNDEGSRIGGNASVPTFEPGAGWSLAADGFYYYASPVTPQGEPASNLIGEDGIELVSYEDEDGGRQVVEVLAEAIQSDGTMPGSPSVPVVADAWASGVSGVDSYGNLIVKTAQGGN